jgi:hypothetical protein
MARRPWYGFVYYVLGAQGSFVAWLLAATGVYFTYREAGLFVLNREPRDATVSEIVGGGGRLKRWVRVGGVEIDLGSALFALAGDAAAGAAGGEPGADTVLVDRDDPAALAWRDLFGQIEALRAERPGESPGEADRRLIELWNVIHDVGTEKERARFLPAQALVVVNPEDQPAAPTGAARAEPAAATATAGAPADEGLAGRWRRRTAERVELIRRSVRIDVMRQGLLEPFAGLERKYRDRYGLAVAGSALVVGHRPSPIFAVAFAGFGTLLLFLIVGLRALRRGGGP